jgi:signal recognition particle receptor subunit beta
MISENVFIIENKKVLVYDVGGQRKYRLQWAPYFETNIDAIIFVVSLSSYDQTLTEDESMNRMLDATQLFGGIINHRLLKNQSIILFLNKKDIFVKKVLVSPVEKYFPDFLGNFIEWLMVRIQEFTNREYG